MSGTARINRAEEWRPSPRRRRHRPTWAASLTTPSARFCIRRPAPSRCWWAPARRARAFAYRARPNRCMLNKAWQVNSLFSQTAATAEEAEQQAGRNCCRACAAVVSNHRHRHRRRRCPPERFWWSAESPFKESVLSLNSGHWPIGTFPLVLCYYCLFTSTYTPLIFPVNGLGVDLSGSVLDDDSPEWEMCCFNTI